MATALRKHFWLITTTFIALAMLLLASTSNLLVEFAFLPRISSPRDEQTLPAKTASRPRTALEASRLAKLTGVSLDKQVEKAPAPGGGAAMNTSLRMKLLGALANMDGLLTQARVVPAFRDGKPQGFKVFAIKKGSLHEHLGIQSGDVLRRINGVSLDAPDRALESFMLLRGASYLELDIERGGGPLREVYDVK